MSGAARAVAPPSPSPSPAPPPTRRALGVALILGASLWFALLDTNAKYLGQQLPVATILWCRYAVQALLMAVWLGVLQARSGRPMFVTAHPRFQLLRGVLLLLCSALLFFGVQHMPVAEYTAVGMLTPVVATVLAALFLHERLTPLRAALVVGGFAGALTIVRPGSALFGWFLVFPLAMTLAYAVFQLLTRKLAGLEHPLTTHFYTGLVGTVVMTGVMLLSPGHPWHALTDATPQQAGLLFFAGLAGTAGHLCLILALGMAPMATLMPFTYSQIAFANLAGWAVFRHVPDGWAFIGMAIVAACGAASVWLTLRDAQHARAVREDAAPIAD